MVGSTCTFSSDMMKTAAYVILFYIRVRISFGTVVHRDAVLNCMPRRLLYMPFPSNWGSDDVSTPSFGMDRNSEIRLESGSAVRMGWLADVFAHRHQPRRSRLISHVMLTNLQPPSPVSIGGVAAAQIPFSDVTATCYRLTVVLLPCWRENTKMRRCC
jgi:hypothetical protein